MARPTLFTHRKLPRLARFAGVNLAEALGLLEFLWNAQYNACSEVIGDAVDVEVLSRWEGQAGVLTEALVGAGFVDERPDGKFVVHDFWDHAPDYVHKRLERETSRKERGATISDLRAKAGRKGAEARWGSLVDGKRMASERQPMAPPTPTPTPRERGGCHPAPAAPPPSLSEVASLWAEEGLRGSPERFWNHWEARGWKGIVRWEAEARKWSAGERSEPASEPVAKWGEGRPPEADLEV